MQNRAHQFFVRKVVLLHGCDSQMREQMLREAELLQQMHHCNIIQHIEHWFDRATDSQHTITEYCPCGSMEQLLNTYIREG